MLEHLLRVVSASQYMARRMYHVGIHALTESKLPGLIHMLWWEGCKVPTAAWTGMFASIPNSWIPHPRFFQLLLAFFLLLGDV